MLAEIIYRGRCHAEHRVKITGVFQWDMHADLLIAKQKHRNAPELETAESIIIIGEDVTCCDVRLRDRGKSGQR